MMASSNMSMGPPSASHVLFLGPDGVGVSARGVLGGPEVAGDDGGSEDGAGDDGRDVGGDDDVSSENGSLFAKISWAADGSAPWSDSALRSVYALPAGILSALVLLTSGADSRTQ